VGAIVEQIRERLRAALPRTHDGVLPGAGHSFPVTRSEELAAILQEFLATASAVREA
jgi:pimeloyl-ACP methyl ester carboxylesterase